ncbi:MAG: hypothetical protein HYT88_01230 [Candidatus Omnitrophica bacterium]|nr:hypothetical protein [Candidatus Omnitrophota bacterium]MBI2173881.1 hypothetical protein [Candidatus Omnitrophota bacterium]MBI3009853.1 hypothetical protein [Candidatus Omnitrophota bacterium]
MKQANLVKPQNFSRQRLAGQFIKCLPQLIPSLAIMKTQTGQRVGSEVVDLAVEVKTPTGSRRRLLLDVRVAQAPSRIRESLRQLASRLPKPSAGYPMLASTFLSPRVRQICREEGFGYLDLAGNCYVHDKDLHVEKIVEENPFPSRGRPPSLFAPISSRILRAVLEEPQRRWQVSELAVTAEVSLGQSSQVCRRLIEEEYARHDESRRFLLTQPERLLESWREAYSPQPHFYSFYSFIREPQALLSRVAEVGRQNQWRYAATSFTAASLVAPFVRGIEMLSCYVADEMAIDGWKAALDLRPVEEGPNVVFRIPYDAGVFYRTREVDGIHLCGDIQVYLDLWQDPARGREQAEFLRKERLGF